MKCYTKNDLFIVLVQMHFIQPKQFSETTVTSHFNKFQIWRFFLNASAGYWKCCGRPHAAADL